MAYNTRLRLVEGGRRSAAVTADNVGGVFSNEGFMNSRTGSASIAGKARGLLRRAVRSLGLAPPQIFNQAATDCGPACLGIVLEMHGYDVSHATLLDELDPRRDGTTAKDLLRVAAKFGLKGWGLGADAQDLGSVVVPCILHMRNHHFVVLESVSGDKHRVLDPAVGLRQMGLHELRKEFAGTVLEFERSNEQLSPVDPAIAAARTVLQRMRCAVRLRVAGGILVSIACGALTLLISTAAHQTVRQSTEAFRLGLLLALLVVALKVHWVMITRLQTKMRRLMTEHVVGILERTHGTPHQAIRAFVAERMSQFVMLREDIAWGITAPVHATLLVSGTWALVALTPPLRLLWAFCTTTAILVTLIIRSSVSRLARRGLAKERETEFALLALPLDDSLVSKDALHARLVDVLDGLGRSAAYATMEVAVVLIGAAMVAIARAAGVAEASFVAVSVSASCAVTLTIGGSGFLRALPAISGAGSWPRRLASLEVPTTSVKAPATVPAQPQIIEWVEITVSHGRLADPVVSSVSFSCARGELVLIVGSSGSGKSSLVEALCGRVKASSGHTLLDGLKFPLSIAELPGLYAHLPQRGSRLFGSIRHCVTLSDGAIKDEMIWDVLSQVGLFTFVEQLPMGLDTPVGPNGSYLSAGEQQRLCLARTLARSPHVLALDEPLSELDDEVVAGVVRGLCRRSKILVIATHRLELVQLATRVVVLRREQGAKIGTPGELGGKVGIASLLMEN